MTPTAQEAAEQTLAKVLEWLDDEEHPLPPHEGWKIIADALTTFAHARERAVWEEAAQRIESLKGNEIIFNNIWDNLAEGLRRRATHTEGKEGQ